MKRVVVIFIIIGLIFSCVTEEKKKTDFVIISGDIGIYGKSPETFVGLMNPSGILYELRGELVPVIRGKYLYDIVRLKGHYDVNANSDGASSFGKNIKARKVVIVDAILKD